MSKIFSKIYKGEIERAKWSRNAFHHSLLFNSKYNSTISSGKWAGLTHFFLYGYTHRCAPIAPLAFIHFLNFFTRPHQCVKPYEKQMCQTWFISHWYTLLLVLKKTHNFTEFIIAHSYYTGILFPWHENKNLSGSVCSEKVQ